MRTILKLKKPLDQADLEYLQSLTTPITAINFDIDDNELWRAGYALNHWIPVSEQLPYETTEVLVSIHDDHGDTSFDYTSIGWLTPDMKYWIVDNDICYDVVAWMPLPAAYEEPKKK